jgi:hypothetical protein
VIEVMPLRAYDRCYGEQGLQAPLAIETAPIDDTAGQQKITEALELGLYRSVLRRVRL